MKKAVPVHITPRQSEHMGCLEATNVRERCYHVVFTLAANQFINSD